MKAKKKLLTLSLLTGALVLTTSSSRVSSDDPRYLSNYYDVIIDNICTQVEYEELVIPDDISFVPTEWFVPQGLTIVEEKYVLISMYDYLKDRNSFIDVYDLEGNLINTCVLDIKAHVGGISYDMINEKLWVCGNEGCIRFYDIEDVLNNSEALTSCEDFNVGNRLNNYKYPWLNSASYLTIYDNKLFVGSFALDDDGLVKVYSIEKENNDIKLDYSTEFKIPDKVQGINFYNKDGKTYVIFSRSYGANNPSVLQIYSYDKDIDDYNNISNYSVLDLPPMLEQTATYQDSIVSLYERNAKAYNFFQSKRLDSLQFIEINQLIKRFD